MVNLEEKQEWERVRAEGYNKHILSTIVREGVPEGVIGMLLTISFNHFRHRPVESVLKILPELGTFILALGWARAVRIWDNNEREYAKAEGFDQNEFEHPVPGQNSRT